MSLVDNRKEGWYWVKGGNGWICMYYDGDIFREGDEHYNDRCFDDIGERIGMPGEDILSGENVSMVLQSLLAGHMSIRTILDDYEVTLRKR